MEKNQGFLTPIENNRPASIAAVQLGCSGISYVQSALIETGDSLSLRVMKLFNGSLMSFSLLEDGATLERSQQFRVGSNLPTIAIKKWLANYMVSRWGDYSCQLLFADPWVAPREVINKPPKLPYFLVSETVYYEVSGGDAFTMLSQGDIQVKSFLYHALIITPAVLLPPSGASLTQSDIELLAQHTRAVLASAYAHEGYVVYERV